MRSGSWSGLPRQAPGFSEGMSVPGNSVYHPGDQQRCRNRGAGLGRGSLHLPPAVDPREQIFDHVRVLVRQILRFMWIGKEIE